MTIQNQRDSNRPSSTSAGKHSTMRLDTQRKNNLPDVKKVIDKDARESYLEHTGAIMLRNFGVLRP
jgi:hypothetical protein